MDYLVICLVAFIASALTLFSGFGLGTILTPVFVFFFPLDLAIALTAIVHFLNNIFKLILVGKNIDKKTILLFGLPSMATAFLGAFLLTYISDLSPICQYKMGEKVFYITPLKLVIGMILMFFSVFDLIPKLANLQFNKKYLPVGGLVSGFFGGLSGQQGALRSAFLIRTGLSKESYIATGVILACIIDTVRIAVYSGKIFAQRELFNYPLIIAATLSAFAGALIGNKLVKKITIKTIQIMVAVLLFIFSVLLISGII